MNIPFQKYVLPSQIIVQILEEYIKIKTVFSIYLVFSEYAWKSGWYEWLLSHGYLFTIICHT